MAETSHSLALNQGYMAEKKRPTFEGHKIFPNSTIIDTC